MKQLTVLIAENNSSFREQIRAGVEQAHPRKMFYFADSSDAVFKLLRTYSVDLLFIDLNLGGLGGIATATKIRQLGNQSKIVMTTMKDDRNLVMQMIRAGVNGYVFKFADTSNLENAIESVLDGRFYFSEGPSGLGMSPFSNRQNILKDSTNAQEILSSLEIEILTMICEQHKISEIVEATGLEQETVTAHINSIMKKTDTRNSIGLALYAVSHGYLKTDRIK